MLEKGATLVCTDLCPDMLIRAKDRFEKSEWAQSNKVKFIMDEVEAGYDIETLRENESDRVVFGCLANNECLPFKDSSFDCYIANLSLMLVHNYRNQLSEALRVTQPGSPICFTIWGRSENTNEFDIFYEVMIKYGLLPPDVRDTSPLRLSKDLNKLKAEMLEMGFANIHMWF